MRRHLVLQAGVLQWHETEEVNAPRKAPWHLVGFAPWAEHVGPPKCQSKELEVSWYLAVLKNYVGFSGRARRKEYWMYSLISLIIYIILAIIDRIIKSEILYIIYALAVLLPSLAVGVRRLHDTDRTGWWLLIGLIPVIGGIILIVFFCIAGDTGDNKYGPDPKGVPAGVAY